MKLLNIRYQLNICYLWAILDYELRNVNPIKSS